MTRVLVIISPRMYREAVALSIHRNRPGVEVRLAPPEDAEEELTGFRPHLLVHNDTAGIDAEALAGVPCRVKVLHSDSMSAETRVNDHVEQIGDMDTAGLLRAVDGAAEFADRGAAPG